MDDSEQTELELKNVEQVELELKEKELNLIFWFSINNIPNDTLKLQSEKIGTIKHKITSMIQTTKPLKTMDTSITVQSG